MCRRRARSAAIAACGSVVLLVLGSALASSEQVRNSNVRNSSVPIVYAGHKKPIVWRDRAGRVLAHHGCFCFVCLLFVDRITPLG